MSVLFVDVRGFTALAEQLTPADVAERLNKFYALASDAVFRRDGTVDKLVGDQVMAFFGAPVHQHDHARRAVETALEIVRGVMAEEEGLQVGGGVATGEAFVGNVGGGGVSDYTVLGDTVNVAARLQGAAAAGEILLTEETYAQVAEQFTDAGKRELELKGKSAVVTARVMRAL
ncbi:MAG TPA: adenylate/guanylate cyclase domain-containing protein [Candidatus Binatia bacterium]